MSLLTGLISFAEGALTATKDVVRGIHRELYTPCKQIAKKALKKAYRSTKKGLADSKAWVLEKEAQFDDWYQNTYLPWKERRKAARRRNARRFKAWRIRKKRAAKEWYRRRFIPWKNRMAARIRRNARRFKAWCIRQKNAIKLWYRTRFIPWKNRMAARIRRMLSRLKAWWIRRMNALKAWYRTRFTPAMNRRRRNTATRITTFFSNITLKEVLKFLLALVFVLALIALIIYSIQWFMATKPRHIGPMDKSPNHARYDNRKLLNSSSPKGTSAPSNDSKSSRFEKVTYREAYVLRKDTTYRIYLDQGGFAIISQNMEEELSLMFRNEKTGKRFSTVTMRNQHCISYKLGYEMGKVPPQGMYLFTPKKDIECSIKALSSITRCQ